MKAARGSPRSTLLLAAMALAASSTLAWNPIRQEASAALRWDVSSAVVWNPDGGVLGSWSNATAVTEMDTGFGVWDAVGQTTINYAQGAQIVDGAMTPVDVTAANYAAVIALDNGQNPVVFDNDRQIFDMLGTPGAVLGFAGFLRTDGAGTITKGYAVMEGDWIDGDAGDGRETTLTIFRGAIVHEIGHFGGLGHSEVNGHLSVGLGACPPPTAVNFETMNPFGHDDAASLHHDDRIGISSLYPSASFINNRARIQGTLFGIDGVTGFDGANMILRVDTANCTSLYNNAQATQSGVNSGEDGGPGSYLFRGLTVPNTHTLEVAAVQGGGSYPIGGASPPSLPAPGEFYNGANESTFDPPDDPAEVGTLSVTTAGTTVSNVDVFLNAADGPAQLGDGADQLTVEDFDGQTPGPQQALIQDDDDFDTVFGFGGATATAWLSRFTPAAGQLPFRVDAVRVLWSNLDPSIVVGRSVELLVYVDAAGTGDPGNATHVALTTPNRTITALNTFVDYALAANDQDDLIVASGDVYLGFFDREGTAPSNDSIATADLDTAGGTSWVGFSNSTTAPSTFQPVTDFASDQTWMIRAIGANLPVAGSIRLSWGDPCNAQNVPGQDFAVYQGNISSLSGVQDHAPILCGTGFAKTVTLAPVDGNKFWLIAPLLSVLEGSQGAGTSSPRAPVSTCRTVQPGACP